MTQLAATVKARIEGTLPATVILPGMLAVNTAMLLGLDALGAVPSWLKTAATLFLAF